MTKTKKRMEFFPSSSGTYYISYRKLFFVICLTQNKTSRRQHDILYMWICYCFLQLLDLSRNRLNGFDDIFVWKLRQIKDVKLENNPLICDRCHMGVLIDIAQTVRYTKHERYDGNTILLVAGKERKEKLTNNNIERTKNALRWVHIRKFKNRRETFIHAKKGSVNGDGAVFPFFFPLESVSTCFIVLSLYLLFVRFCFVTSYFWFDSVLLRLFESASNCHRC